MSSKRKLRQPSRAAAGSLTMGLAMALMACGGAADTRGSGESMDGDPESDGVEQLADRPDIEEALSTQKELEQELTARLASEVGLSDKWKSTDEEAESPCGEPYSNESDALEIHLPNRSNDEPVPEGKWDRALRIFTEVADSHGFDKPEKLIDEPNNHKVRAVNKYGGEIAFGTRKATALYSITGCHLTQQAHPGRNKPSPSS